MANPSLQIGNGKWAIKEDSLLGYTELGNNIAPVEIDMTRASAGTRVNSSGLVETVELLGSEEVTGTNSDMSGANSWVGGLGSLDFNINTTVANKMWCNFTTGNQQVILPNTLTIGKTYFVSLTARLNSGTATTVQIGGFTSSQASNSVFNIIPTSTTTTYTGYIVIDNTSLSIGVITANNNGSDYEFDNVSVKESTKNDLARVNYTGSTSSLLAEPQRTNLETTSASGSYGHAPASEILAIAPDGLNTAIRPVPDTTSDRYNASIIGGTYSSGDEVTYSWYRKRFSTPVFTGYIGDLGVAALVNATQVGVTTEIASNINGYDRFSATLSITDGSINSTLRFYFGSVVGIGNSSVAYWGHQLEQGSYATSYIPTSGQAGGVTRVQDTFTKTGISDKINSEEGVLFVEMAAFSDDLTYRLLSLNDGTTANRMYLGYVSASNTIESVLRVSSVTQSVLIYDVTNISKLTTDNLKIAVRYKLNDFALFINGIKVGSDTTGNTFSANTLNVLSFDSGSGGDNLEGKVKQLQIFKTALTDSELIALTTI